MSRLLDHGKANGILDTLVREKWDENIRIRNVLGSVGPPPAMPFFCSLLRLAEFSAKRAQLQKGEQGPLRPQDLLEARDRLARDGRGPPLSTGSLEPARERGMTAGGFRSSLGGGGRLIKGDAI